MLKVLENRSTGLWPRISTSKLLITKALTDMVLRENDQADFKGKESTQERQVMRLSTVGEVLGAEVRGKQLWCGVLALTSIAGKFPLLCSFAM